MAGYVVEQRVSRMLRQPCCCLRSLQLANADPKDNLRGRKIADELVKLLADGCVKVEAELSDEQKKEWRSIRGKPFDLGSLFQSRPVVLD
jgi:hypothetical protein